MSALRCLRSFSSSLRTASASRTCTRATTSSFRTLTTSRTFAQTRTLSSPFAQATRSFSVTPFARGSGETDLSLSQKLQEEIQFEAEAAEGQPKEPEFVTDFKANGVWKIEDIAGNDEVVLSRIFGNESIRVVFSIADIDTPQESFEDPAAEGEEAAPEAYPVRCSITITKPSHGALTVDAVAQEGILQVDNISFYKDDKLATDLTAEADWKRRGLYIGPQFDHLDVSVQEEFEKYLEERGVGANIAVFVPDYAEYKEQKEYMTWLENVKRFVDQ